MKFHFKEVTSLSLICFYIVMLPKSCLVLLVIALAKVVALMLLGLALF
jgi:hypothetical protein